MHGISMNAEDRNLLLHGGIRVEYHLGVSSKDYVELLGNAVLSATEFTGSLVHEKQIAM